ncbi:MAG: hypothetical protein ACYCV4_19805, partial [Dermatophilaceae bacterium]
DGRVTGTLGEKYYAYEYYPDANWADAGDPVIVQDGSITDLPSQTLLEGATINGAVFADDGLDTRLAGIEVIAHVQFGGGWPVPTFDTTDELGAYSIVGLPPGTYAVRFHDPTGTYASEFYNDLPEYRLDLADKFTLDGPASSVWNVHALLDDACIISGTVTGGATPLNDATVRLFAYNSDGGNWMWAGQATTANDGMSDGWYAFPGLRAGTYRMMVEGPDTSWASECYNDKPPIADMGDDITVGDLEPLDKTIDVALVPTGGIEGTVVMEGSGDPIVGSSVSACIYHDGWYEAVAWDETDGSGAYVLDRLATGTYYVQFGGIGSWVGEIYDDQRDWQSATPVAVLSGQTRALSPAVLSMGATIEGYVYAEDGTTPLGGIAVTPVRRLDDGMGNVWFDWRIDRVYVTDTETPDGHFVFEGLEPGEWAVHVSDTNGVYAAQYQDGNLIVSPTYFETIAAGGTWSPVDISMVLGGSIAGTVYDGSGQPLEGMTVVAWLPFGGGYEWVATTETGADGAYQIDGIKPGNIYLEFLGNSLWLGEYWSDDPVGGTMDRSLADSVTVNEGLIAGPFDAHLDSAASLSGYVTTGGGATALENIDVVPMSLESDGESTWWNHRWELSDITDADGLFEIGGLTPGVWSLMYMDPSGTYATHRDQRWRSCPRELRRGPQGRLHDLRDCLRRYAAGRDGVVEHGCLGQRR